MTGGWWEEDEDDVAAAPAVPRARDSAEEQPEELWAERYPRPQQHTPPPGLSRRARRRWLRDVRREDRQQLAATARSWRRDRPESATAGLGVVALAVVLAVCALVWFRSGGEQPNDGPRDIEAADSYPQAGSVEKPSSAPSPSAPLDGHDHELPEAPAGLFEGAAGETAYAFVLGYLTYSPAYGDPVDTWLAGWEQHATGELVDDAPQQAQRLWDFTVQQAVHVTDPRVVGGFRDGDRWQLDVAWTLFPIGGDESSAVTEQVVTIGVTVAGEWVASVVVSEPRAPA